MSAVDDEKPPPQVSTDPSCSRNSVVEDGDWVIVKKQRITILVPPPSPDATRPQADVPVLSSKQSSLTIRSKRDWDAARKKHPDQLAAKISQDIPPQDGNSEKAQANHLKSIRMDVPMMAGEILPHIPAAPIAKSEWNKGAGHTVQGSFHQESGKTTSSLGSMDKPRMLAISSPVATKIMRARLLERRVARLGGLRNWLFDCGLGWFVDILDSEKLGMYQLVSLTMNQLKEMGLVAVGPRRKLIHAIDSLCHPHQVEMVS